MLPESVENLLTFFCTCLLLLDNRKKSINIKDYAAFISKQRLTVHSTHKSFKDKTLIVKIDNQPLISIYPV